jgi:hypothetical protein
VYFFRLFRVFRGHEIQSDAAQGTAPMNYRLTLHAGLFAALLLLSHWAVLAAVDWQAQPTTENVGPTADGGWIMPTGHKVRSAGTTVAFAGRPVDAVLGPLGDVLYVKDNHGLLVIETADLKIRQKLAFPSKEGASMYGLAMSHDGKRLFATTAQRHVHEAAIDA